jgi:hypothetical protein
MKYSIRQKLNSLNFLNKTYFRFVSVFLLIMITALGSFIVLASYFNHELNFNNKETKDFYNSQDLQTNYNNENELLYKEQSVREPLTEKEQKSIFNKVINVVGFFINKNKLIFSNIFSTISDFFVGFFQFNKKNDNSKLIGQVEIDFLASSSAQAFKLSRDTIKNNKSSSKRNFLNNISRDSSLINNSDINSRKIGKINQLNLKEEEDEDLQSLQGNIVSGTVNNYNNQDLIYFKSSTSTNKGEQKINTSSLSLQITEKNNLSADNFLQCNFASGFKYSPFYQKVIINEVAWMGTAVSANDEWIELKNISGGELSLKNWQLIDLKEDIRIVFGQEDKRGINNYKIKPQGFYLLERTNDDSVPNKIADFVYTGTLSNSDEGLRLFDNNCALVDEVLASPNWPAGNNSAINDRRTMERKRDLAWQDSADPGGTPGTENSTGYILQKKDNDSSLEATSSFKQQFPAKILINEVQITAGPGKTDNDFIELYNPNDFQVNLKGYRLVKRTKGGTNDISIKSWTQNTYIPAKGYYLWANSNYLEMAKIADATTTASISSDNGIALRWGGVDDGEIIDSLAWGEGQDVFIEGKAFPLNIGAGQSIQRKFLDNNFIDTNNNAEDFEIRACPSPKDQFLDCFIGTIENFNITFSSTTRELIFGWQAPRGVGSDLALVYYLFQVDDLIPKLIATTTLNTFIKDISTYEGNREYIFWIRAFGDRGISSVTTTAIINIPTFNLSKEQDFIIDNNTTTTSNSLSSSSFSEIYSRDIFGY